jgi:hypothetical protein
MPGLVVTTGVRVGATGTDAAPASSLFIAGTAQRGPYDDYRLVRSVGEFERTYGVYDSTATLHQHLQTFFEEGGTRAYVIRVVGPAATGAGGTATKNLAGASGTALTLTAQGPGSWSTKVKVSVVNGVKASTRRLEVYYDDELVFRSADVASNLAAKEALDTNVGYYFTTEVGAGGFLAVAGASAFSAGTNDNGNVRDQDLVNSLDAFVPELGAGVVCIPSTETIDYANSTVWDGLQAHALDNNRIAFCSLPYDDADTMAQSVTAAKNDVAAYYGTTEAQQTDAGAVAFFWPHMTIPTGTGSNRIISPESFAAAARCRAHLEVGPWRPAAGVVSASRFVNGLIYPVNSVTGEEINDARINTLRVIEGTVRVYGARSVSGDETNWRYITFRDTVNYIVVEAQKRLEPYVFGVIDSRNTLFGSISAALVNLLEPLRAEGALYEGVDEGGNVTDRGYTVEVSDALNPTEQLAAGTVAAKVGVRVSTVGETISLTITKSGLTSAV